MQSLPSISKKLVSVLSGMVALATTASADSCDFLGFSPSSLSDGQLYYRIAGTSDWSIMPNQGLNLGNQAVTFAYVVHETIDDQRAGVVVFKSGRTRQPDEPQTGRRIKRVQLVRPIGGIDNGRCGVPVGFPSNAVSAQSYDDYHDQGKAVPEARILNAFHIKYTARRNACRSTDNNTADSLVPRDPRSNRGQFSFDADVVDNGTYSQILAFTGITSAYASSDNLEAQRVEMRQYRTVSGQPTCVNLNMQVKGRAAFLRVNDLEALTEGRSLRLVRAPEHRWSISSP